MRWLVLMIVLAMSRPAAADRSIGQQIENIFTGEDGDPNAAGKVVVALYAVSIVGCSVVDLSAATQHIELSRSYGVAEAAFHLPIAALWGIGLVNELQSTSDHTRPGLFLGFAAVHAALATHGIATAVRRRREPVQLGRIRAVVTPLGIAGSF